MKKKIILLLTAALMAVALMGCGTSGEETDTEAPSDIETSDTEEGSDTEASSDTSEVTLTYDGGSYTTVAVLEVEGENVVQLIQVSYMDLTVNDEMSLIDTCEQYAATYALYDCVYYAYESADDMLTETIVIDTTDIDGVTSLHEAGLISTLNPEEGLTVENVVAAYEAGGFTQE